MVSKKSLDSFAEKYLHIEDGESTHEARVERALAIIAYRLAEIESHLKPVAECAQHFNGSVKGQVEMVRQMDEVNRSLRAAFAKD